MSDDTAELRPESEDYVNRLRRIRAALWRGEAVFVELAQYMTRHNLVIVPKQGIHVWEGKEYGIKQGDWWLVTWVGTGQSFWYDADQGIFWGDVMSQMKIPWDLNAKAIAALLENLRTVVNPYLPPSEHHFELVTAESFG